MQRSQPTSSPTPSPQYSHTGNTRSISSHPGIQNQMIPIACENLRESRIKEYQEKLLTGPNYVRIKCHQVRIHKSHMKRRETKSFALSDQMKFSSNRKVTSAFWKSLALATPRMCTGKEVLLEYMEQYSASATPIHVDVVQVFCRLKHISQTRHREEDLQGIRHRLVV